MCVPSKLRSLHVFAPMLIAGLICLLVPSPAVAASFQSQWDQQIDRAWIGRAYWANPMQDWRLTKGRLECIHPAQRRNVNLLTHQLRDNQGGFEMSVVVGRSDDLPEGARGKNDKMKPARLGFRIGIQGPSPDYRSAVFQTWEGFDVGITPAGALFIGEPKSDGPVVDVPERGVELRLKARPAGDGYEVALAAHDPRNGERLVRVQRDGVDAQKLTGNMALLCDAKGADGEGRVWFRNWRVSGDKIEQNPDHAFGPIFFSQYTLSRGIMKLTAQMAPVGAGNNRTVRLQTREEDGGNWRTVDEARIDKLARTARFRIENWDDSRNVPYRVAYEMKRGDGKTKTYFWSGTIRRDPVDKRTISVAGFTGHFTADRRYIYPNVPLVRLVGEKNPDVLVFTGDQLYEGNAGYGIVRNGPMERITLDYMNHWLLWGWSFGDLMRDRPTITLPDDHDVYQGNVWGARGRSVPSFDEHPRGGYVMPPEWVNMIQRTQTSHLPDPYDPTPVLQGISVYYTDMLYGRISFAIFEDRKFKSGPEGLVPQTDTDRPDHIKDPDFDVSKLDLPEATLLGKRQLKFLRDWAADWRGADMKMAVSQTLFAQIPNIHGSKRMHLAADLDSNGWPQTPRDNALYELRKGFAFHLSGDQHLPMIVHYGTEQWGDAPYTFCVPSINAGYPREFHPEHPPLGAHPDDAPPYVGRFYDGFHNKATVLAVANPAKNWKGIDTLPQKFQAKSSGFGMVYMDRQNREITMECWKYPTGEGDDGQFEGWPQTISMLDNYARPAKAYLPTIEVQGMEDPVVQVINEHSGEIVYTLRINGTSFRPMVFRNYYKHTIRVGEPGRKMMKISGVKPLPEQEQRTIEVDLRSNP